MLYHFYIFCSMCRRIRHRSTIPSLDAHHVRFYLENDHLIAICVRPSSWLLPCPRPLPSASQMCAHSRPRYPAVLRLNFVPFLRNRRRTRSLSVPPSRSPAAVGVRSGAPVVVGGAFRGRLTFRLGLDVALE
ncbi:hypothetical protein BV22DRAFT_865823 [Leucogyrophana mollusca]|uniref:Uncharacterized protein n=1 Tax=Leucogyrophana mollusca TaxID=85980 RepID=A0ACB8B283_9AGAM|nr:hypothetical protein BV22DRAFT_865823 [Leucogyrophana mollusca]